MHLHPFGPKAPLTSCVCACIQDQCKKNVSVKRILLNCPDVGELLTSVCIACVCKMDTVGELCKLVDNLSALNGSTSHWVEAGRTVLTY